MVGGAIKNDASLLKKVDIQEYLKRRFIPLRIVGDVLELGVVEGLSQTSIRYFADKYSLKVKVITISRRFFLRAIQSKFSDLFLKTSTRKLQEKLPVFSAHKTLSKPQTLVLMLIILVTLKGGVSSLVVWFVVLNLIFLSNTIYKAKLFFQGRLPREKTLMHKDQLPTYTIILPVLKEDLYTIKELLNSIAELDYPKNKKDVKLIVEQFDRTTLSSVIEANLLEEVDVICVKRGAPKTKPKACNYGLKFAKGEYLVVYDAEDRPEKGQLKKAVAAFRKGPKKLVCLQASLRFYNKNSNIMTRLMGVEYRLWFDRFLDALERSRSPIPLGGNSNHFKVQELRKVGGWDSYNVTEDADLGIRLFKRGYTTQMLSSETFEEAPESLWQFIKQRSRWIKGHLQTYFVHLRSSKLFFKKGNVFAFINFNVFLFFSCLGFLYPFVAAVMILFASFVCGVNTGLICKVSIINMAIGFAFSFYSFYVIAQEEGCDRRWRFLLAFLAPFYFFLHSIASVVAFVEIFFCPHYWHKTQHNFHNKQHSS
ncbi:MAG: glycosyltransferase family 2 protein [Rickettsiales bacterium]